jgi:hypothetical protein
MSKGMKFVQTFVDMPSVAVRHCVWNLRVGILLTMAQTTEDEISRSPVGTCESYEIGIVTVIRGLSSVCSRLTNEDLDYR